MIDRHEHKGLDKLSLYNGASDSDDRLIREDRHSFRDRPHVTLEFKISEILQKLFTEAVFRSEVLDIFVFKFQILKIIHHLFQTRHDGKASAVGHSPEKHIEICYNILFSEFKIAVGHRKLVKVGEHRIVEVFFSMMIHRYSPFCGRLQPGLP